MDLASQQRGKDVPQHVRDGNHRSFVHPCGHDELDGELVRRTISPGCITRLPHALYAGERNAAVAHPFVCAIVHESELLPVHHLARPRGELPPEQGLKRSPSRRCRFDDVGLVAKTAESNRAAANPTEVCAAAIGQSIASRTVCEHAEHDVSPPSSRVSSGNGRRHEHVWAGRLASTLIPPRPHVVSPRGFGDVVLVGPPLTGECQMNAVAAERMVERVALSLSFDRVCAPPHSRTQSAPPAAVRRRGDHSARCVAVVARTGDPG